VPVETVRSISVQGPGSYGRNDAGDAAADAVILSMLSGRPVRVQGSRQDGHAWDPKGTPSVHKARAALDADGKLLAYEFSSKGFSRMEVATAESEPSSMLAGMLLGFDNPAVHAFGAPEEAYEIPNRRMGWETIATQLSKASPLRTSHLRDPLGPQLHFASECFMDECALAAGADPVAFRLAMLNNPRHRAVIEAAAQKAGWKAGPPGSQRQVRGGTAIGRGFAYTARGDTVVAVVAEVEVDRASGRIWPKRFTVAHDCGLIVNPEGLRLCIEGNVVHATSRALFEEVKFDQRNVTSGDWMSYPILDIMDAPETVEVVLIDRPELPPSGAGEPSTRPIAAAIANAVFDATGVRLRRAPFTRDRMKAALASHAA
jgi:CO/xanthine dehydrogenase Mo-binding subunit